MKKYCFACRAEKDISAFRYRLNNRPITYIRDTCNVCRAAKLRRDGDINAIYRVMHTGEISLAVAEKIRDDILAEKEEKRIRYAAEQRERAYALHARVKLMRDKYGIRTPTKLERGLFMDDPAAGRAFDIDQLERRARYEADTAREQARRDKISAALKGKPRAPRRPSAAALLENIRKQGNGHKAPAPTAVPQMQAPKKEAQIVPQFSGGQVRFVPDYGDDD
jgi:hypothetical protein